MALTPPSALERLLPDADASERNRWDQWLFSLFSTTQALGSTAQDVLSTRSFSPNIDRVVPGADSQAAMGSRTLNPQITPAPLENSQYILAARVFGG